MVCFSGIKTSLFVKEISNGYAIAECCSGFSGLGKESRDERCIFVTNFLQE
jgi:hypothetical protein